MMDWVEDIVAPPGQCSNVCAESCHSRDDDMCDEVDGEEHLLKLVEEWGYSPLLPSNLPPFPPLHPSLHFLVGLCILISGALGALSNGVLLAIHLRLKQHLLDPTGIMMANFLFSNFAMSFLQCPFSSSSSFAGRWLYGELGCQLYAAVGFFLGIGIVFNLGLLILDRYLQLVVNYQPKREGFSYWIILITTWHSILLFAGPPLLDVFGRYGPEPSGTMCTIDYWHGNFRYYNAYVYYLVIFAYGIPLTLMFLMYLSSVRRMRDPQLKNLWSAQQLKHHQAMIKTCGLLLVVQAICWSPYSILVIWTVIFPPSSLSLHWTLLPPLICKLSPFLNAAVVWLSDPRISAAARYLRSGDPCAPLPPELGNMLTRKERTEATSEADPLHLEATKKVNVD